MTIHIDDGRRWLNRNPDVKFDLILQNTTYHWRSHITNLLSEEYLRLCKSHLNPGGVIYYNTTGSDEVPFTAARVFKHVVRYSNFIAAGDSPFDLTRDQVRDNLLKFVGRRGAVFAGPGRRELLDELAATEFPDQGPAMRSRRDLLTITDDNMATEYKLNPWLSRQMSWPGLFRRCGWEVR